MKKAFTLSELLITLTIVGVVAVLATPRLISNMDMKQKVTALQRTYKLIGDAATQLMIDERVKSLNSTYLYDPDDELDLGDSAGLFLTNYFEIKEDCGTSAGDCFASGYKNINGDDVQFPNASESYYYVTISTGVSLAVAPSGENYPVRVMIDLNGPEKPNVAGRDFFRLFLFNDGEVGDRYSADGSNQSPGFSTTGYDTAFSSKMPKADQIKACKINIYGGGCFNRIKNAGWTMDY